MQLEPYDPITRYNPTSLIQPRFDPAAQSIFRRQIRGGLPSGLSANQVQELNRIPGAMQMYAGNLAPDGWLICDGSAVSRETYADLFDIIGTTYGTGDGATTFNLPNMTGKVPVGVSTSDADFDLGDTGGAKTHALTTAELASHVHSVNPPNTTTSAVGNHTHGYTVPNAAITVNAINAADTALGHVPDRSASSTGGGGAHDHTVNIAAFDSASAGSGTAHNNLQPFLSLNFIIRY